MFLIDTNILVYAANPDAPEHGRARALLSDWRSGDRQWFVTWGIIYEFLRVTTHPRVFSTPITLSQSRQWISALTSGNADCILVATDRHADVLADLVASHGHIKGNLVHDLHIAALMLEHGVPEIRTADADFRQFGVLRVVNPLVEP